MLESIHKRSGSLGVKIVLAMIVVVFIFWGVGGLDSGSKNVLATVNGKPISTSDFMRRVHRERERLRGANPGITSEMLDKMDFRRQILQNMIAEELISEEMARLQIGVSPAELKAVIVSMPQFRDENGVFSSERYSNLLAAQGYTPASYEALLEKDILQEKLARMIRDAVGVSRGEARDYFDYAAEKRSMEYIFFDAHAYLEKNNPSEATLQKWYEDHQENFRKPREIDIQYIAVTPDILSSRYQPTEEQLQQYYEENAERLFHIEERVHPRHILIGAPMNASTEARQAAKEKAEQIAERLKAGEDFGALAIEVSEDSGSAAAGGDIGWVERGKTVAPFEEIIFGLKPGEISDVFATDFGYHIARVDERQEERIRPLEEVRAEASAAFARDAAQQVFQQSLDEVLDDILAGKSLAESAAAHELAVQTETGLTDENTANRLSLSPGDVEALFLSPVGIPSDRLFGYGDGYILVMVENERPSFIEPYDAVKEAVLSAVRQENAEEAAKEAARKFAEKIGKGHHSEDMPIASTSLFGREGFVTGLGMVPDIVEAVFSASDTEWIAKPFDIQGGTVIVRLKDVQPPTDAEWQPLAEVMQQGVSQNREEQAYRALVQSLWEKSDIKIRMPELLQGNSPE